MPRTLILEPTRELAAQVAENFDTYGKYNKLTKALIIGGTSMEEQSRVLDKGVDVLIATPGRLLDLYDRGGMLLNDVKILVIDEADRMLDMGFIPDVEKIVSLLNKIRQTLFFSATMPAEIKRLADSFLINPKEITVARPATTSKNIEQHLIMIPHTNRRDLSGLQKAKRDALRQVISRESVKNALIFCNRKRDVDTVHKSLQKHGYNSATLHGDMSQPARMETMTKFKADEIALLVCSDVAARGLDIDDLGHVFNFDVPIHAEDYVHRIGRTGRAGKTGRSFTLAWREDEKFLDAIEEITGEKIPLIELENGHEPDNRKNLDRPKKPETNPWTRLLRLLTLVLNMVPPRPKAARADDDADTQDMDEPVLGMGDHVPAFYDAGHKDLVPFLYPSPDRILLAACFRQALPEQF